MRPPSSNAFSLPSRYQRIHSASSAANRSAETPRQSLPWKNSTLSLPKNPSQAAFSGECPLRYIDLSTPASPQARTQSGVR